MFKRIDHMEIVPSNAETTIRFYVDVLGFTIKNRVEVKMPPMREVVYLQLGDTVIEIIAVNDPQARSKHPWEVGYMAVALEVTDMSEAVTYLRGKGIAMAREPMDLGNSYRAEIRDPDGLIIELRQWK